MGRFLDYCAQENQRRLQKFPGIKEQAWEGQTRRGQRSAQGEVQTRAICPLRKELGGVVTGST